LGDDLQTQRVEGSNRYLIVRRCSNPLAHFARGFSGERECKDVFWSSDSCSYEKPQLRDYRGRLPGTSACNHETAVLIAQGGIGLFFREAILTANRGQQRSVADLLLLDVVVVPILANSLAAVSKSTAVSDRFAETIRWEQRIRVVGKPRKQRLYGRSPSDERASVEVPLARQQLVERTLCGQNSFVMGERVPGVDEAAAITTAKPTDRSRVNTANALPLHGYTVPENTSSPRYFQDLIPWDTLLPIRLAKVQGFGVSAHCPGPAAEHRARKSRSMQFHSSRSTVN
jgi:hypothetical protein